MTNKTTKIIVVVVQFKDKKRVNIFIDPDIILKVRLQLLNNKINNFQAPGYTNKDQGISELIEILLKRWLVAN